MELIGRAHELGLLDRARDEVLAGGTRAVAIVGEAGIGKSALLAALAARAAPLRVLTGRAAEHEREVPFALAVDAFDAPAGELAPRRLEAVGEGLHGVLPIAGGDEAPVGPVGRLRAYRVLASLLGQFARERPVALLLDDVHWADDASLELLDHLVRRPPDAPHLIVLAARPGARLPDVPVIRLGPLDRESSLALLGAAPGREAIADTAAGNPLFLRELSRGRGDGLPGSLVAAIQRETASLDPAAAALLAGAAVAGDPFDPELAAAAAGATPAAATLDVLCARDLVCPTGDGRRFAFRHPLVRRSVYDALPPAGRLEAHERAAAALAARGAGPAARAYHVERCGRPGDAAAVAVLRAAAERTSRTAPATAARWYGAALRLVGDDPAERAALLEAMGFALAAAGRFAAAREALGEAHALAPSRQLRVACARVETELGRYADARRRLLAEKDCPEVALELAAIAYHEGRLAELQVWAEPALRVTADDPLRHACALALCALAAAWTDQPDKAQPLLDQAVDELDAVPDEALALYPDAAVYVATAQLLLARFPDVERTASRALGTGDDRFAVPLHLTRALARLQRGALDAALTDVDACEELARVEATPRPLHFVLWLRALVEHERGAADAAARAARECAALTRTVSTDTLVRSGASTAAATGAAEHPARAMREIVAVAGRDVEIADRAWSAWLLLRLVRAALVTGDPQLAEHWARVADERSLLPVAVARARVARAEVALANGDAPAAARLAGEATAAAERADAPLDALDARLLEARAQAAADEPDLAKDMLQRITVDAAQLHAFRLRDAAARELRALGTRVGSAGRRAAGGELTDREREIAALVATGSSNQQVASILHLSEKTVANALTRIYAKLRVRSRTQLAVAHSGSHPLT